MYSMFVSPVVTDENSLEDGSGDGGGTIPEVSDSLEKLVSGFALVFRCSLVSEFGFSWFCFNLFFRWVCQTFFISLSVLPGNLAAIVDHLKRKKKRKFSDQEQLMSTISYRRWIKEIAMQHQ